MSNGSTVSSLDRALTALLRPTTWLASAIVAILCMTTVADTVSRTLGGGSIPLVFDVNETLLIVLVFLSLGYAQIADEQIAFTLLYERMSPPVRRVMLFSGNALVLGIVAWTAWESWLVARDSLTSGERRLGIAGFAAWPARLAIVVGLVLLAIVLLRQCSLLVRGRDVRPELKAVDAEDL